MIYLFILILIYYAFPITDLDKSFDWLINVINY